MTIRTRRLVIEVADHGLFFGVRLAGKRLEAFLDRSGNGLSALSYKA